MEVFPSRMMFGRERVLIMISFTAHRPLPSIVGSKSWAMLPAIDSARLSRACVCASAGKESMMRSIVFGALFVWSVPNTSIPISAAVMASEMVS